MEASKKAKMFRFIAVGAGLLTRIICIVLWIFVFGMAAVSNTLGTRWDLFCEPSALIS